MPDLPIRIVLLRPRNPENLGAVARAMKNFGLSDWAIAALGTHDFGTARRVAVHAEELLDRPRLCTTLDEAVADCAWVVGTSSRAPPGKRRLTPAAVAAEALAGAGRGPTALVFGDERSGLTNAELDRCHDVSAVPTDPAQPSLNLAQAVLVYAYELARAARPARTPGGPRTPGAGPGAGAPSPQSGGGASDAALRNLEVALRSALRERGFLVGPERHAVRDLLATLVRARLSPREVRLWAAALRTLGRPPP